MARSTQPAIKVNAFVACMISVVLGVVIAVGVAMVVAELISPNDAEVANMQGTVFAAAAGAVAGKVVADWILNWWNRDQQ